MEQNNILEGVADMLFGIDKSGSEADKKARSMAAKAVVEHSKTSILTRAQKYMIANIAQLDQATKDAISNNQLQFVDAEYYVRKIILAGNTEMLNTTTVKKTGTSSFDKNALPDLVNFVLAAVRVAYANAVGTDPGAVSYANSGAIPASIVNGDLIIKVSDKPILEIPLSRFFNTNAAAVPNSIQTLDRDWINLESPKLIPSGRLITMEVRTAEGVALPANNNFIEVKLAGSATRTK